MKDSGTRGGLGDSLPSPQKGHFCKSSKTAEKKGGIRGGVT